jgi:hypothetical protein
MLELSHTGLEVTIMDVDFTTIPTVTVNANPSGVEDPPGLGAVAYPYDIGQYEVTQTAYVYFLNDVADSSDPLRL